MKPPQNLKALRQALGFFNFYRRFVYNFAGIARPLTRLTRKNTEFIWSTECQNSFDTLKKCLLSPPIVGFPRNTEPFRIYTDASQFSCAALLAQIQDGEEEEEEEEGEKVLVDVNVVWSLRRWSSWLLLCL